MSPDRSVSFTWFYSLLPVPLPSTLVSHGVFSSWALKGNGIYQRVGWATPPGPTFSALICPCLITLVFNSSKQDTLVAI